MASDGSGGDGVRFDGSRRRVLAGTCSALAVAVAGCAADQIGDATETDSDSANETATASAKPPDCSSYTTLSEDELNGGVTLEADCYRIEQRHEVDNGTLTLEGGVLIEFDEGAGLKIEDGGGLETVDTGSEPVFLRGRVQDRGYWRGIRFLDTLPDSTVNTLENVVIEHAGSGDWWRADVTAAVLVENSSVEFDGATIRDSGGWGLAALGPDPDLTLSKTSFETNEKPLRIHADHVGDVTADNTFGGNVSDDRVTIHGSGRHDTVTADQTWRDPSVAYDVAQDIAVDAHLTIESGTTLEFAADRGLSVDGGDLTVSGTDDNRVRFEGAEFERGHWKGIRIHEPDTSDSVIEHAYIEGAGGAKWHNSHDYSRGGIYVQDDVEIRNCMFLNNDEAAVTANQSGYDFSIEECRIGGNAAPLWLTADQVGGVATSNSFDGNDDEFVRVGSPAESAGSTNLTSDATWAAIDVPYRLTLNLRVETELDIDPGATLEFEQSQKVRLPPDSSGVLKAGALDADAVTFTGVEPENGYWSGIDCETPHQSELRNVVIEYGGCCLHQGTDSEACLAVWGASATAKLSIEDSVIRGSGKHGIFKEDDADLRCPGVTFEDIPGDNIHDGKDGGVQSCRA